MLNFCVLLKVLDAYFQFCSGSYTSVFFRGEHNSGFYSDSSFPMIVSFTGSTPCCWLSFMFLIHNKLIPIIGEHPRYWAVPWLYSRFTWEQVELPFQQESRLTQELRAHAQFPASRVWWLCLWCGSLYGCRKTLLDAHFNFSNTHHSRSSPLL